MSMGKNFNNKKVFINPNDGTVYRNDDLREVYHQLFDDALKAFNEKQTRAKRRMIDYFEKIQHSKQEKLFRTLVIQIGNQYDTPSNGAYGKLAGKILDEYYQGFQVRNPYLWVFAAQLRTDTPSPRLEIAFVPFTTNSKRGLDTRVSFRQALVQQGFKENGTKDTAWTRWILSEKEQLADMMARYGMEWEQRETYEQEIAALSQQEEDKLREIESLDEVIIRRSNECDNLARKMDIFYQGICELDELKIKLSTAAEYQLPDPTNLMSAKAYRKKIVEPLIHRYKVLIYALLARAIEAQANQNLSI